MEAWAVHEDKDRDWGTEQPIPRLMQEQSAREGEREKKGDENIQKVTIAVKSPPVEDPYLDKKGQTLPLGTELGK